MRYSWPPRSLGLGPPLNLITLSPEHRAGLGWRALQSIALAVGAAIVIATIDQLFFDGATARRTPSLNVH
ncbi:MAG TPA: hypothetical protein VM939_05145, partial [Gemmatimonadaceae bacterium]|nr:hypothetical protein [Gemmatimonadaceae bacterium]